jgi:uncharacterized membrane-anchored protein YhcB (DUF1043 family)
MGLQTLATGILGGIGGGSALFALFGKAMIGRLEAKWNRELTAFKDRLDAQQRHLQTQLDSSLFVTRAHFEVELNAMREVHQLMAEVKVAFQALHPYKLSDERHGEERAALVDKLRNSTEKYFAKLTEWGAFLEMSLYDSFEHCYYGADEEWKRLSAPDSLDRDGALNSKQFFENYSKACRESVTALQSLPFCPAARR